MVFIPVIPLLWFLYFLRLSSHFSSDTLFFYYFYLTFTPSLHHFLLAWFFHFILCVILILFFNVLLFLIFFLQFANFVKVWECVPKVSFYGNNCHWAARQLVRTSTYENRTGTVTVTVIITTVILTFSSLIFHSIINLNKE